MKFTFLQMFAAPSRSFAAQVVQAIGLCIVMNFTAHSQNGPPQPLPQENAVLISEAFHIWKTIGNEVWPGWTGRPIPLVLVGNDVEYAIGFPPDAKGFAKAGKNSELPGSPIRQRKREFEKTVAAALDVNGINAVVIGLPSALGTSPNEWVLTAIHEMFHVWQYENGSGGKIKGLAIGPANDASWQINFPFSLQGRRAGAAEPFTKLFNISCDKRFHYKSGLPKCTFFSIKTYGHSDALVGHWEGAYGRLGSVQTISMDFFVEGNVLKGTYNVPDLSIYKEPIRDVE